MDGWVLATKIKSLFYKIFTPTIVSYGHIYKAYGHFNSWKPFVFDRGPIEDNSLFRHLIQNRSLLRHVLR